MARQIHSNNKIRRSHDFPDINLFPAYLLQEAAAYYEERIKHYEDVPGRTCLQQDFIDRFQVPLARAQILLAAAKFKYEMKKKGLA